MNITSEKNIIFFVIILFFALIAILFYFTGGKKIEERGLVQDISPSSSLDPSQAFPEAPVQNNAVQMEEDNGVHTIVRYEQGSFSPLEVTAINETGCFVEIQNMSDQDVIVRVGPYDPRQEKGFLYPPIAPRKSSLIDPRYGTITQFSFYNKNNPDARFVVHVDPTCL